MSLCVAWKYEDPHSSRVYFAADSCAVVCSKVMPYGGIKVLEIPVRIISSFDANTGHSELLFSANYGMAFAGSYLTAFLLKELVTEVLGHLQFLKPSIDISFDKICLLVSRFHKHFHGNIRDQLECDYELDFFLGGYCPMAQKFRVAKFSINSTGQPTFNEILMGSGFSYETIGFESGCRRFNELMDVSLLAPCPTHFAVFRRLWDIIRDPEIKNVKGAIQYGEFEDKSFKLVGAFDAQIEDNQLRHRTFVRGTDIEEIHNPSDISDLHIHYSYGNPFHDDIKSFDVTKTFWEMKHAKDGTQDPIRHVLDEQITIYPHDPRWQQWYQEECGFLRIVLGTDVSIEHIGSTAVPGLPVVPVIDILVGVEALGDVQKPPFNLEVSHYEYLGDKLMVGQRCYRKRGERAFNLYITVQNGDFWNIAIHLRDYLRQHPEECVAYGQEKVRILNTGSWTLARYSNEKSGYFEQLIAKACQHD